jgi:hydrogenase-4 component B
VMPALLVLVAVGALFLSGRRLLNVRRVPAWRSATGGVEGGNQHTPFGFANPTRKVLATVLTTKSELVAVERETGGRLHDLHRDVDVAELRYTSDVMEIVERLIYRPLARPLAAAVRAAKRLQSGRLGGYVAYMLIALVAALALVLVVTRGERGHASATREGGFR